LHHILYEVIVIPALITVVEPNNSGAISAGSKGKGQEIIYYYPYLSISSVTVDSLKFCFRMRQTSPNLISSSDAHMAA
jgi:hypothetical protein